MAPRLEGLANRLDGLSSRAVVTLSVLLLGELMVIDYATGTEISFSIFYLMPVGLASWFAGRRAGLLLCLVSGVAWTIVDVALTTYSHAAIQFWNSLVRLGGFAAVSLLLSEMQRRRARHVDLVWSIVDDLRAPLHNAGLGLDALAREAGPAMHPGARGVVNVTGGTSTRGWPLIPSRVDRSPGESAEIPLELRDVSVDQLTRALFDHVGLWAWNRGIRLEMDVSCESTSVRADVDLTARVLTDLLARLIETAVPAATIRMDVRAFGPRMVELCITRSATGRSANAAPEGAGVSGIASDPSLHFCEQAIRMQHGHTWFAFDRGEIRIALPHAPAVTTGVDTPPHPHPSIPPHGRGALH